MNSALFVPPVTGPTFSKGRPEMAISPAAIAALCDDLSRWRDRIQTAIGNDSLDWQSFVHEVNDDADGLLARLILVDNAAPLANAIDKETCEGCHLVMLNVGGNAWKGTSEGKSVISDLELCREFGENVKRRVANALAAVEQLRTDAPPNANPTSPQQPTGAAADDGGKRAQKKAVTRPPKPRKLGKSKRYRGPNVTHDEAKKRRSRVADWKRWKAENPKSPKPMKRYCDDETAVGRPIDPPTLKQYVNWVTKNPQQRRSKRA